MKRIMTLGSPEKINKQDQYYLQEGHDLGQKMEHAVEVSFQSGAERVIVVGTDCPALSDLEFIEALKELEHHDLVYVPADDGGYVMVGFSGEHYEVFQDVEWGTETVMRDSLKRAKAAKLDYKLLAPLPDVDRPEDIEGAEIAMSFNNHNETI